jgi:hypothetical protein
VDELCAAVDVVAGDIYRARGLARDLEQLPPVVPPYPRGPAAARQLAENALAREVLVDVDGHAVSANKLHKVDRQ